MAFQIKPLKAFLVRPALPPSLSRMSELAYNLLWTWDHNLRTFFRRIDPALWKACGNNPVLMLGRVSEETLERAAADPRLLALYRRACERYDAYMQASSSGKSDQLIAYFSMEYGLTECLPIYSGGLGLLSGDHLKASSDADMPLTAVGLLYQMGYLRQYLNQDGWQQERYPINDFYTLPVSEVYDETGKELKVSVKLPTGPVAIKVWRIQVGRVNLYCLDTNLPENTRDFERDITDSLYGGDIYIRMRQEIVLGIGGIRALKAMGLSPTVFHMNEGHSAFLAIERIRLLMQEEGLSFEEAHEASRHNNVFTTHTSVPAGIDIFDAGVMYEYFHEYCVSSGITFDQFLSLGRKNPADNNERFSMAILAFKTSAYRNAVSKLHREVSQDMWQDLWPNLPTPEIPITSVTNGVHLPSYLNGDFALVFDQYLQPDWRERYPDTRTWDLVRDIPDQELWEAHKRRKRRLIAFVRERMARFAQDRKASNAEVRRLSEVLDPEAFTIGFARRFATYKRATLLFRDVNRLRKLLTNTEMPVQIVIAGKAHPKDHPGKTFIRDIYQLSKDPALARRLVFLEDYGIEVARDMVQGVDLWLNTPRRGEEACGTSGMKASINGVLNFSILDGWFDEAYEISGGWAIGDRVPYAEDQDEFHASAIYSLLENEIVPMYYSGGEDNVPEEWVGRMKQCLTNISPAFNCQRMVGEYMQNMYQPAHEAWSAIHAARFTTARERSRWNGTVQNVWHGIKFVDMGPAPDASIMSGSIIPIRTTIDLAGLQPSDVRVEAVVGRVGPGGQLEDGQVLNLPAIEQRGTAWTFGKEFVPHQTGLLGYSLRVSPNHDENPLTRPCNSLLKWGME
ncbi:MAG: alpha-glucan family phosphorylase [Bryobacteraceae bacterium]|nr:alpha-glucan family phosphorylase [Bryobacteraceae bacterium]